MAFFTKKTVKISIIILSVIGVLLFYFFVIEDPYRGTTNSFVPTNSIESVYTYEEAKEDIDYVFQLIEARHFSCIDETPTAVKEAYENAISGLKEENTLIDIWKGTSMLLNSLNDAHASTGFVFSESVATYNVVFNVVSQNEWYITIGDNTYKLISLYDIEVSDFYEIASQYFSYENEYYLNYTIERKIVYPLYSAFFTGIYQESMPIEVEIDQVITPMVLQPEFPTSTPQNAIDYEIDLSNDVALLSIRSMIYNQESKDQLQRFFEAVKENEITNIAIDLRENGGGNSLLIGELFRYFPMEEYQDYGTAVRYRLFKLSFDPKTVKNDRYEDLTFNGDIYLLTSNRTFSSAAMLTTVFRDNQMGLIYGEPIGNEPSMFGDVLRYQMPQTNIAFVLTYKQFTRPDSDLTEKTITPDVIVSQDNAYARLLEDLRGEE